jgi:Domain of unknown function (DUF4126)
MEALPLAFTTGWASGINAYACVLMLGLLGRFADVEQVPDSLTRTDVMTAAAVMFALEFVTDKIPYVDSAWDAISTVIRPTIGAVIAVLIASDSTTLQQAVIVATGGLTALVSHLIKGSLRLTVNTSPEPVTNIAVSSAEDVTVVGVVWLAAFYPEVAAVIAGILLLLGAITAFLAIRAIRRGLARFRAWRARRSLSGVV